MSSSVLSSSIGIPRMLNVYKIPDTGETRIGAYNWGIKPVKENYRAYGDDWVDHAPQDTQNYINYVVRS